LSPAAERSVISLYTGAGGLDLGLEIAGYRIAGCVEFDEDAKRTLRENRPEWQLADPGDVHEHDPHELLRIFGLKPGDAALVSGGPPCQPFSKSSLWVAGRTAGMDDPRSATLGAYIGIVEAALPAAMLLENVVGIRGVSSPRADRGDEPALKVISQELERINRQHGTSYVPHVLQFDAAVYGVPQHRERVFVFADREGNALEQPLATHAPQSDAERQGLLRFANAWDAIGHLDEPMTGDRELVPTGFWADLLRSIPEGANYQWHTPRGGGEPLFGWRTKFWSFLLKLAKNRPAWTLQAMPGPATGPFHWRSRKLRIEEMARLQTFPTGYEIAGSYASARRQLGNAVPSAVGELLGLAIREAVFGEVIEQHLSLVPQLRDDCPRKHPIRPVPNKYLPLRADHRDHPGVGRGPGAMRRIAEVA
jgi:DNA (cytosine-5)-methyltransferase 1